MRTIKMLAIAVIAAVVPAAAFAQTVGIAGAKSGFTAQASSAIAKVVSEKTDIKMRAQTFSGSSVYVPQVSAGTIQFGLANELETEYAVTGTDIYDGRPQPDLQIATLLVPFRVAIFSRKGSGIDTIADLKGKRVPSGWTSQKIIDVLMKGQLASAGLAYDDVVQVPVPSVVASADDFAEGKLDIFFFVFGAGKVKETDAKVGGIQVVEIDASKEGVERMRKHVPPAYGIKVEPDPANVGVHKPVNVMAYDYLMLTNKSVPEDQVYTIVKAMHGNAQALTAAFPGMRLFSPDRMTKKFANVRYHTGAEKYFKEIGQWPPK